MSTYLQAGVNLNAASQFVHGISKIAADTFNEQVLGGIGGFAGLYRLPTGYTKPILVACTDGVGSKLKLAYENNKLETIGQDLVAMCVNDLLCSGAKPLFFLDYLATESLNPEQALVIAASIGKACKESGAVLLGGETAELPGMLPSKAYELAGFTVGIVDEDKILNPQNTSEGDILIAIPSSGVHSNGYSLVRSVIKNNNLDLNKIYTGLTETLIDEILKPTALYTKLIDPIMGNIKAISHITGGGLPENLPRSFNKTLKAEIQKGSWQIPPIFELLQSKGNISEEEMFKVFNMGIGLVLIVEPSQRDIICQYLEDQKQTYSIIGRLTARNEASEQIIFV
jgi:phosphoribosylformylglycinamidine cyclo-ligase